MTNKEKDLKRERVRLRKSQNPQQVDYRRIDKLRSAKTEFWKMKKKSVVSEKIAPSKKDAKKVKPEKEKKKKKVKEPELEVIEDKPELEVIEAEPELEVIEDEPEEEEKIDKELEDLYSYDDDEVDDEETEEEEAKETSE